MIKIDLAGDGPFTGIVCGFEFYAKVMKSDFLPDELKNYEIVADHRMNGNIAFLIEDGKVVTTYLVKYK